MNILHIAPHLGGGVGKAHAAIAEAVQHRPPRSGLAVRHVYALLEEPRDVIYADRIRNAGCEIHVTPDRGQMTALAAAADIVQIEWWNHPRLYNFLVTDGLPEIRLIAWLHISGLVSPLVPRSLVELVDQTLFTSPCSFEATNLRGAILRRPKAFGLVNSGFGFDHPPREASPAATPLRFGYLGTLDFLKMHPNFFDFVDAVESDICVHLWGRHDPDGEVVRRAAAMRFPERIRFAGYADDPARALSELDVLVYLLAPDHYGTAENALIEAMSVGAVPIVLANKAESCIVKDRKTGFVVDSEADFVARVATILADPDQLSAVRQAARDEVMRHYSPETSVLALDSVYGAVMRMPKRRHDFAAALGVDARSWFLSSLPENEAKTTDGARLFSRSTSKGSLGHFRSCFPQDESLTQSMVSPAS